MLPNPNERTVATGRTRMEGNDYESQRARRVRENQNKLRSLGIAKRQAGPPCVLDPNSMLMLPERGDAARETYKTCTEVLFSQPMKRKKPRRRQARGQEAKVAKAVAPSRTSKRIRGETPEKFDASSLASTSVANRELLGAEDDDQVVVVGRRGRPRSQLVLPEHDIKAPFTLRSIGVTVWSLGEIYRGEWKNKFWSSTGCLYHHAYPVGYKATKRHFNRSYTMWIEAGDRGPVFFVREEGPNPLVFKGESPTKPWTKICVHKKLGTRISGPLHFGFSDPCTQSAIAKMYNEGEMEAALAGSKVGRLVVHRLFGTKTDSPPNSILLISSFWQAWNDVLSPQEKAAKDFMEIEGVGERAAMALATTTALGGTRHGDRKSLAEWAARDGGEKLKHFLLTSEELGGAILTSPGLVLALNNTKLPGDSL